MILLVIVVVFLSLNSMKLFGDVSACLVGLYNVYYYNTGLILPVLVYLCV